MLLEELTKNETLNIDFHNHLQTGSEFRKRPEKFKEKIKNLFLEEGFSDLTGILNKLMDTELDILYITDTVDGNGDNQRYINWTSDEQIQDAREKGYEIEPGKYYVFFKKEGKIKVLGNSKEIESKEGHIVLAGIKRNKRIDSSKISSLEEALAEATDGELKIADHPYTLLDGKSGTLRRSKNPEQDAKKFDALEQNGNFYFPISISNILVKRKNYNKPIISNSDGHHPKDIGKTYNILDTQNLDYSSERAFRDSINYEIRQGNFDTIFSPIPMWRVFHHALMMGIYMIRDLYKKIFKKDNHNL